MIRDVSLRDLVLHPISVVGGLFAFLGGFVKVPIIDAIWGATIANAGALFAAAGVASRFPSMVPVLTAAELQLIAFLTGGLFVLTRVEKWLGDVVSRLRNDNTGDETNETAD